MTSAFFVFWVVCAGVFGALIGSFLNVVVYRVPAGRSIVSPPSACGSCGTEIKPYDNIPVVSWLWLRGRCRTCRAPISARYPIVEALTATLFVVDVAIPDFIPFIDEILLGLGTLILANLKQRRTPGQE